MTKDAFSDLTPAEAACCDAMIAGVECILGDGDLPLEPTPERRVRAAVLRRLLISSGKGADVSGLVLTGAWVDGALDLAFQTLSGRLVLRQCRFDTRIDAQQLTVPFLSLSGSHVAGLDLGGARIAGHLQFRRGFHATGRVRLSNAKIGGQLSCRDGLFDPPEGQPAVEAANAEVRGNVLMDRGFRATGRVDLMGARIGGQLSFEGAQISAGDGDALNAQRLRVAQSLIFRNVEIASGAVDMAAASVGDLVDTPDSWPLSENRIYLNGFTYERIGGSFTDLKGRLAWLARGTLWQGDFFPQPYRQLSSVLAQMGHDADAQEVLIALEQRSRAHDRAGLAASGALGRLAVGPLWLWDSLQRLLTGYGYAAGRALYALAVLVLVATLLAKAAWDEGSMAPAAGVVLLSPDWRAVADDPTVANPAAIWSADGNAGQDWETFNALAYGADMVVPILDFGQTAAWAPSTTRGLWGSQLWWMRWLLITAGWLVTALGAAAITGIIRRA